MPPTITLVVPRAENESVFLQLVIQAAIRAHRDDHPAGAKTLLRMRLNEGIRGETRQVKQR